MVPGQSCTQRKNGVIAVLPGRHMPGYEYALGYLLQKPGENKPVKLPDRHLQISNPLMAFILKNKPKLSPI
jgi:hypothetical protein